MAVTQCPRCAEWFADLYDTEHGPRCGWCVAKILRDHSRPVRRLKRRTRHDATP